MCAYKVLNKKMAKKNLEYTVIKSPEQYNQYCNLLEKLLEGPQNQLVEDKADLLTLLIEKWDEEHTTFKKSNPVELLQFIMQEHKMNATALADILGVSKGLISDILNYKKGFSKEIIRKLAERFKVRQEAFNREYQLKTTSVKRPARSHRMRKPAKQVSSSARS
jgi:HTH-type transcriptional regulator/antitoxin HigA